MVATSTDEVAASREGEGESQWAVETHGLTKRFKDNIAVDGVGPGGNNRTSLLVPETRLVAICVIIAWLVGWTALGAWRMVRRDA